jgi:hypothetical protein
MQDSKTPFCCSKFPRASERISPKIIDNLGARSHNRFASLGLVLNEAIHIVTTVL